MLIGIGFLTVITVAITSTFVSRSRLEPAESDAETSIAEQLRQINARLERIETRQSGRLVALGAYVAVSVGRSAAGPGACRSLRS